MNKPIGKFSFFELAVFICNHISQTSAGYCFGDESENFLFRDVFTADYSRSLKREFFDRVLEQLIESGDVIRNENGLIGKRRDFGTWELQRAAGVFSHQDYFKILRGENPVADVGAGFPFDPNQMLANAQLIAAAPELLEALENLIFGFAGTDENCNNLYKISRLDALQMLAAIAKARGRTDEERECREAIREATETKVSDDQ